MTTNRKAAHLISCTFPCGSWVRDDRWRTNASVGELSKWENRCTGPVTPSRLQTPGSSDTKNCHDSRPDRRMQVLYLVWIGTRFVYKAYNHSVLNTLHTAKLKSKKRKLARFCWREARLMTNSRQGTWPHGGGGSDNTGPALSDWSGPRCRGDSSPSAEQRETRAQTE